MKQNRLDIFTRKVSSEERIHSGRIAELETQIRDERKILDEREHTLTQHMEHQQRHGAGYAEKQLTQPYIEQILSPTRQHVKKLEQELINLKRQAGQVQKAGSRQSDIFHS